MIERTSSTATVQAFTGLVVLVVPGTFTEEEISSVHASSSTSQSLSTAQSQSLSISSSQTSVVGSQTGSHATSYSRVTVTGIIPVLLS